MIHQNAAAYVLDALDSEAERGFERHLEVCPECEAELEPLRVAATALAFAGELPRPRAALRKRVLAVDALVVQLRRRWTVPLASAAALAACAALVVGLRGSPAIPGVRALQLQRQASGLSLSGRLLLTDEREADGTASPHNGDCVGSHADGERLHSRTDGSDSGAEPRPPL